MTVAELPVFVCVHDRLGTAPCCAKRGGGALLAALREGVAQRGLAADIQPISCLGLCELGANVRVGLGKTAVLLHGVTEEQVPAILDEIAARSQGG